MKFLGEVDLKNLRTTPAADDGINSLGQVLSKGNHSLSISFAQRDNTVVVEQLEHLAGALEEEVFNIGEFIIRQGSAGDYFYILEEGEVDVHVTANGTVRSP